MKWQNWIAVCKVHIILIWLAAGSKALNTAWGQNIGVFRTVDILRWSPLGNPQSSWSAVTGVSITVVKATGSDEDQPFHCLKTHPLPPPPSPQQTRKHICGDIVSQNYFLGAQTRTDTLYGSKTLEFVTRKQNLLPQQCCVCAQTQRETINV